MQKAGENKVGRQFEKFKFRLELSKVRELALAIGDTKSDYLLGEKMPPTIATVVDLWGEGISYGQLLELNLEKVLYGGQKYEYYTDFEVGEEITVTTEIADVQKKKSMDLYTVKREYKNEKEETAVIGYTTIIERH